MFDFIHKNMTYDRRVRVLAKHIAAQIEPGARILDIGCGDGQISELVASQVQDAAMSGIDVMERSIANIDVSRYDGLNIPFADNSVDYCVFVDVLHHADQPLRVMQEASRVARKYVVIKDHLADGFLGWQTLRFMDWVGNERHGVALPYNYFKHREWQHHFEQLGLKVESWNTRLDIYPVWCSWAFDRKLHFVAKLAVPQAQCEVS